MQNKLKILLNITYELAQEKDLRKILVKLNDLAKALLNADRCSIFLHDDTKNELWTMVAHGVKEIRIPENFGIAGTVFQQGEILNIIDAYNDPRFDNDVDKRTGYHTKSMVTIPLRNKKLKIMGVFQVINKLTAECFDDDDINLLNHIALYASASIENALLYEKLKQAHEDVVYRLSNATKFKDPETENHIIRVGHYCAILATAMEWDEEEVELIKLAAPMHDIGKVGIPDRVLLKPGKLNTEEWDIMKKHTTYGYKILKDGDSKLLQMASIVALEHHERWDGLGYPNGKIKDEISILGRMTAIADVFDALTSNRPYKKAWSIKETLRLSGRNEGKTV